MAHLEKHHQLVNAQSVATLAHIELCTGQRCRCELALLLLERKNLVFDRLIDCELVYLDVARLAESMRAIEGLLWG